MIRLFEEAELKRLTAGGLLFSALAAPKAELPMAPLTAPAKKAAPVAPALPDTGVLAGLDPEQRRAG